MVKYDGIQTVSSVLGDDGGLPSLGLTTGVGGGGFVAPPIVKPVITSKPVTVQTVDNNLKLVAATAVTPIKTVVANTGDVVKNAVNAALNLTGIAGTPVSTTPTTSMPEVTVTATRTYWWLIVIIICVLAAILGYATSTKKKGFK